MTEPSSREILDRLIRIETMLQPLVDHRAEVESRLRAVEQTAITREEMDRQHRRTLGWVSLLVTVLGLVVAPAASLVIALLT